MLGNIRRRQLISADAVLEGVTGLGLIVVPQLVSQLLFAAELDATGMAAARVAGIALFSLSVGAWWGRRDVSASVAMLIYNLLVTLYLTYLGIGGQLVGVLLWPAAAIHAGFTLLLAYALVSPD